MVLSQVFIENWALYQKGVNIHFNEEDLIKQSGSLGTVHGSEAVPPYGSMWSQSGLTVDVTVSIKEDITSFEEMVKRFPYYDSPSHLLFLSCYRISASLHRFCPLFKKKQEVICFYQISVSLNNDDQFVLFFPFCFYAAEFLARGILKSPFLKEQWKSQLIGDTSEIKTQIYIFVWFF